MLAGAGGVITPPSNTSGTTVRTLMITRLIGSSAPPQQAVVERRSADRERELEPSSPSASFVTVTSVSA
jgi:hypothetical protein